MKVEELEADLRQQQKSESESANLRQKVAVPNLKQLDSFHFHFSLTSLGYYLFVFRRTNYIFLIW